MKRQAIIKINKMGKTGVIILNILKVILILGIVGCVIGTIVCAALPKDLLTMQFSGDATVTVNMDAVEQMTGKTISDAELRKQLTSGNITVDGKDYVMNQISLEGRNMVVDTQAEMPRTIQLRNLTLVCISGLVLCVASLVSMIFAGKVCKAFRDCQSPFEENVIKRMQYFAYSLIPTVLLESVVAGSIGYFLGNSDGISINLNVSTILVVLVVFALVYVFKYGALLQQESDETL
ncbi:MAG: hypothetical protein ACI4FY_05800 [Acetatifactor sp.]